VTETPTGREIPRGPGIYFDSLQNGQQIGKNLIVRGHYTPAWTSYTVSCTLTRTSDQTTVSPDIIETDYTAHTWWAQFSNLQAGATYEADAVLTPDSGDPITTTVDNLTVNANLTASCGLPSNSTFAHNGTLTGSFATGYAVKCCVYQGPTQLGDCGSMSTVINIWAATFNLPYPRSGCRVLTELKSGAYTLAGSVVDNVSIVQ